MINRKIVSIGLIIGMISGICLVAYAGSTTYIQSDTILLPGTPLADSPFATIGNDTDLSSITMECNWTRISDTTLRYNLQLPSRVLSTNFTSDIANQALNDIMHCNLTRISEIMDIHSSIPYYLRTNIDYYQFTYENQAQSPLLVEIGIDNINGNVVEYTEYWRENDTLPLSLYTQSPYAGEKINSSTAESIALAFLEQNGYSVPTTSIHARTSLVQARQMLDHPTYNVYEIVIRSPKNAIFSDYGADGITIHISEMGGHITHLNSLLLEQPDIGEITVLNPEVDYRNVQQSIPLRSWNTTSSLVAAYLRLVPCLDPEGSFALSWRYEFHTKLVDGAFFSEVGFNDAISGKYLYPGLYRSIERTALDILAIPATIVVSALVLGLVTKVIYKSRYK